MRGKVVLAIKKFINHEIRPSSIVIPLLCSYLTNRGMKVKFNNEVSEFLTLVVQSNDNADSIVYHQRTDSS